mgnify:CR=1 FL=1
MHERLLHCVVLDEKEEIKGSKVKVSQITYELKLGQVAFSRISGQSPQGLLSLSGFVKQKKTQRMSTDPAGVAY